MNRLCALLALACAFASSASADDLMAGRWYTEGMEDGLHLQSVVADNPDGTFVKTIRNGTDCRAISTWIETGTWTFDGKRYVETTETVKGEKVDVADAFEVARVDDGHVALTDVKTQIVWTFAKVDPNYTMSPPKDCTV
jgi:opacity protein-like surface antigen